MRTLSFDFGALEGSRRYCDPLTEKLIAEQLGGDPSGVHLLGSGDFHYVTKLFCDLITTPFDLLLIDHHPDMQQAAFGGGILSCGGWVRTMLEENPMLGGVIMVGIDPSLLGETAGFGGRVTACPEGSTVLPVKGERPLYISVDKDAFCPACARTNWGQGSMNLSQTEAVIDMFARGRKVIGADICGCLTLEEGGTVKDQEINALSDARLLEILSRYIG